MVRVKKAFTHGSSRNGRQQPLSISKTRMVEKVQLSVVLGGSPENELDLVGLSLKDEVENWCN